MEIEQKERERIAITAFRLTEDGLDDSPRNVWENAAQDEHLHLQKEVIQPLRDENKRLEAENKALREQAKKDFKRINELEDRLEELGEF